MEKEKSIVKELNELTNVLLEKKKEAESLGLKVEIQVLDRYANASTANVRVYKEIT